MTTFPKRTIIVALSLLIAATAVAQDGKGESLEEMLKRALGGPAPQRGLTSGTAAAPERRIGVPIEFEYNSVAVARSSREKLEQIAGALKDLGEARIRIEGHTDERGSAEYNRALSERRAREIRRSLIEDFGIAASRLESVGYGESRPLPGVSQATEEGRAQNRRVELVRLPDSPPVTTVTEESAESAPAPLASDPTPDAKSPLQLNVWYNDTGQVRQVAEGETLRSHDNYRVSFTPTAEGYVYVFKKNSANMVETLFPNEELSADENPARSGRTYVVPGQERWFTLDTMRGPEEIVAFVSKREVEDPRSLIYGLNEERAAGKPVPGYRPFTYRFRFKHQ